VIKIKSEQAKPRQALDRLDRNGHLGIDGNRFAAFVYYGWPGEQTTRGLTERKDEAGTQGGLTQSGEIDSNRERSKGNETLGIGKPPRNERHC